jgi:hypothetical protein
MVEVRAGDAFGCLTTGIGAVALSAGIRLIELLAAGDRGLVADIRILPGRRNFLDCSVSNRSGLIFKGWLFLVSVNAVSAALAVLRSSTTAMMNTISPINIFIG